MAPIIYLIYQLIDLPVIQIIYQLIYQFIQFVYPNAVFFVQDPI